jgi:hypothetical protein
MRLVIFGRPEIGKSGPRPGRLVYQVIDKDFWLYSIHIMNIPPDCNDLQSGPFVRFRQDLNTNQVMFHYSGDWPSKSDHGAFQQEMAKMIEWCSENVIDDESWFFDLYVTSVSTVTTTFYFSNEQTALEFKLTCL